MNIFRKDGDCPLKDELGKTIKYYEITLPTSKLQKLTSMR